MLVWKYPLIVWHGVNDTWGTWINHVSSKHRWKIIYAMNWYDDKCRWKNVCMHNTRYSHAFVSNFFPSQWSNSVSEAEAMEMKKKWCTFNPPCDQKHVKNCQKLNRTKYNRSNNVILIFYWHEPLTFGSSLRFFCHFFFDYRNCIVSTFLFNSKFYDWFIAILEFGEKKNRNLCNKKITGITKQAHHWWIQMVEGISFVWIPVCIHIKNEAKAEMNRNAMSRKNKAKHSGKDVQLDHVYRN